VADSIKNTLGIDAVGAPQTTFSEIRAQITDRSIQTAFRAGWQGDYPSMLEFLEPIFVTGAVANDVDYTNREFDGAITVAEGAPTTQDSFGLTNAAQQILLADMPVVPLWDYIGAAGHSAAVSGVALTWRGLPDYERIVKS
jgi:oligopeptide transport system substrate-binding protein